ncbi:protein of unknown function [Methylorubrum extorquens]|uniref:Uncharacterized protein n=1 Tax=Methylorubrum extorquens TaxID=408 RepID=A0A2N9AYI6_METEX|nr:protein of unknown function [Methylorubrum extorquens]
MPDSTIIADRDEANLGCCHFGKQKLLNAIICIDAKSVAKEYLIFFNTMLL